MMNSSNILINNEKGATIVYVALTLGMLIMFTALAIDVNHLYAVRNELQDGADAGALAGASVLFNSAGNLDHEGARTEAKRITKANKTGNTSIFEENITVETGHWSFTNRKFTAAVNDPLQTDWQERPFAQLDIDTNFINAVRVQADRPDTPSFFARILNFEKFFVSNDAVAYIGFAGTLHPGEIDRPIAICKDAILKNDAYSCTMGRMLNSGGNANTAMTAMWTNYSQPCSTASSSDMQDLTKICSAGNPNTITFDQGIGSQNGVQDNIFSNVTDCWIKAADSNSDGIPDTLWSLLLPVIDCGVSNTCAPLVGAVEVNVVWIIHKNDPTSHMDDVPLKMGDWNCSITPSTRDQRFACWKEFVNNFKLQNVNGPPVTNADYEEMYQKKNIFFLPDCTPHEPVGDTGGENFGILAAIPKLVK